MASENLPPQIISRVMSEIREIVRSPPEGIEYFDPSENDEDDGQEPSSSSSFSFTSPAGQTPNPTTCVGTPSVSEIYAKISGPEETPFEGGKFLMKLVLSEDYPNTPPRGYFLTKIYHPNIAPNGDICVNTLKKDWMPDTTVSRFRAFSVLLCHQDLTLAPLSSSSTSCRLLDAF